jgi:hypothetical protein
VRLDPRIATRVRGWKRAMANSALLVLGLAEV